MIIGLGIDLVEVDRVEKAARAAGARPSSPSSWTRRRSRRCPPDWPPAAVADAVAVKEAVSKAIGTGWSSGVRWRDVVVAHGAQPARAARGRGAGRRAPPRLVRRHRGPHRAPARARHRRPSGCSHDRRLPAEPWRRNQLVMTAVVFVVFTGFAFVLPFLPLYVRELGVHDEEQVAQWAGVLIGVAPAARGAPGAGLGAPRRPLRPEADGRARAAVLRRADGPVRVRRPASASSSSLRAGIGLFGGIGPLGLAMATVARAARAHRARGGLDPVRADPVRGGGTAGRRAAGRPHRHPLDVPGGGGGVRGGARPAARLLRGGAAARRGAGERGRRARPCLPILAPPPRGGAAGASCSS